MSDDVDLDALAQVKELMGDKFSELVEVYLRSNREHVVKLRAAYDGQDAQGIVSSAHAMKSAAGNLGLMGLSASAAALEASAKAVVGGEEALDTLLPVIERIEVQFSQGEDILNAS